MSQALRRNDIADKFQQVTEKIEAVLSEIPYYKLEISEEVREQVNLYHILEGDQQYHIHFNDGSNSYHFFPLIIFDFCAFKFLSDIFGEEKEASYVPYFSQLF